MEKVTWVYVEQSNVQLYVCLWLWIYLNKHSENHTNTFDQIFIELLIDLNRECLHIDEAIYCEKHKRQTNKIYMQQPHLINK